MNRLRNNIRLILVIAAIIIALISISNILFHNKIQEWIDNNYGRNNYSYGLVTVDTIQIDSSINEMIIEKIKTHNANILTDLQNKESASLIAKNNKLETIAQTRNIYIALLVVIIGLLMPKKESKNEFKNKHRNSGIKLKYFILISIAITAIYFTEIYSEDQLLKTHVNFDSIRGGIKKILESENYNNTYYLWYTVSFDKRKDKSDEIDKIQVRIPRKIFKIFAPNIVQIIYYFVPIIIVIVLYLYPKKE